MPTPEAAGEAPASPDAPAKRRRTGDLRTSSPARPEGGEDSDSDSASSSDAQPLARRALADSDAESAAGAPAAAPAPGAEPGAAAAAPAAAAAAPAPAPAAGAEAGEAKAAGAEAAEAESSDSESSDSESSSEESASSSASEAESAPGEEPEKDAAPEEEPPAVEDEETRRRRELRVLHGAQLRRDEIAHLLLSLPEEEAENAILRSFVRITAAQAACVLAEVSGIERSAAYTVPLRGDRGVDARTVAVQLRCKRGASARLIKITSVSNQDATEAEFEQWKRQSEKTGVDAEYYLEQMKQKAEDISAARKFTYTEAQVSRRLLARPNPEFDAQKESRMRFLVQCALSQMDISGIRDFESEELDSRYRDALKGLQVQEQRSAEMQAEWFEKRPNLFSLKMINQKNLDRQIRDDRHALHYALSEESGSAALNPFQRRACRPVVAWDTKLTNVDGLGAEPAAAAAPAPAAPAPAAAAEPAEAAEDAQLSRLDRVMRAHRRSDLLAKLGPLAAPQAA